MPSPHKPQLIQLDVPEIRVFSLPEGETRLGRAAENDLHFNDKTVSRFQCSLLREVDHVCVRDSESHNPTRVNGQITAEQRLKNGDVLRVGRLRFRYRGPEPRKESREAVTSEAVTSVSSESRRSSRERRPLGGARSLVPVLIAVPLVVAGLIVVIAIVDRPFFGVVRDEGPTGAGGDSSESVFAVQLQQAQSRLDEQTRRLQALQERLKSSHAAAGALDAAYRKDVAEIKEDVRDDNREQLSTVLSQISTLESTIEQLREDRDEAAKQLKQVGVDSEASEYAAFIDKALGPSAEPSSTATVVERPRPSYSKRDIRGFVERLKKTLDDYATPATTVESLEPELTQLGEIAGAAGAEGLLDVYDHGHDLLLDVQKKSAFLKRRTKFLLDRASKDGITGEGSGSREGSKSKVSPEVEKLQRMLELSEKSISIKEAQIARLVQLLEHVTAGLDKVTNTEASRFLVSRFSSGRDLDQQLVILKALEARRAREAVPALLRRFAARDLVLRDAVRQTLVSIAGKDLGDDKMIWEEWWMEEKKSL